MNCTEPTRPWDIWFVKALERGVPESLSRLARDVLRDHAQHGLSKEDWRVGDPHYLLKLCEAAPNTAHYECFEALTWWNSDRDGAAMAFADLVVMMGSEDAVEDALQREEASVAELRGQAAIAGRASPTL